MVERSRSGRRHSTKEGLAAGTASTAVSDRIERCILFLRGEKVMLDTHLAELYGVTVGRLNEAVRRNRSRFPIDFMFPLTAAEWSDLKSQFAISSSGWGGRRSLPLAFTEHGVAMLSSVLNSERAIRVNIEIVRAFVRLRGLLAANAQLARRLDELERKYDAQFKAVFDAIRQLMAPPVPPRRRIGFHISQEEATT
jgi:hypothetical protein